MSKESKISGIKENVVKPKKRILTAEGWKRRKNLAFKKRAGKSLNVSESNES